MLRLAPVLTIAAGTEYETQVYDLRSYYDWSNSYGTVQRPDPTYVIIHHTATPEPETYAADEITTMVRISTTAPYKLPYNFVVTQSGRIYYVNDVDTIRPHTLNYNSHCAVAALGNFESNRPRSYLLRSLNRLCHALRLMWAGQCTVLVRGHREMPGNLTACPGANLYEHIVTWEDVRNA